MPFISISTWDTFQILWLYLHPVYRGSRFKSSGELMRAVFVHIVSRTRGFSENGAKRNAYIRAASAGVELRRQEIQPTTIENPNPCHSQSVSTLYIPSNRDPPTLTEVLAGHLLHIARAPKRLLTDMIDGG